MVNIRKETLTSPDPWEVPSPWWFGEEELLQIKKQNQVLLEFNKPKYLSIVEN